MQALIVEDDPEVQMALAVALLDRGFHVINAESVAVALAYVRLRNVDLVVMNERVGGKLSHKVALAAEHRNEAVATVMITPRVDKDVDELYELLPSLHSLLGCAIAPEMVAQLGLIAVAGQARALNPNRHKPLVQPETLEAIADCGAFFASVRSREKMPDAAAMAAQAMGGMMEQAAKA
jgi:CheY-like chemotaxis protein